MKKDSNFDEEFKEFLDNIEQRRKEVKKSQLQDNEKMKKLHEFENAYEDFMRLIKLYTNSLDKFRTEVSKNEEYKQYSKGGETIHRGYYCPSLVIDLITRGAGRGKLYRNIPLHKKHTYEYTFDKNDKMIKVIKHYGDGIPSSEEYFLYEKDTTISFIFEHELLHYISKCEYVNSKIVRYIFFIFLYDGKKYEIIGLDCEEYTYKEDLFKISDRYSIRYSYKEDFNFIEHKREIFDRDDDGYIIGYTGGEVENGTIENEDSYGVLVKRK